MNKPKKVIGIRMDEDLYQAFQGIVRVVGSTVTNEVDKFMRDFIEKNKKALDKFDK